MIRKSFCLLIPLLQIAVVTFSQIPIGIGQWRTHVPYRNTTSVTDAGDRVYVSGNVFFFSYFKATGEIQRFDKVTGLSDVGVSFVKYNPHNSILLIAYENANIDLIIRNTILNIADIKRKLIVGDKKIYNVYFMGDLAYLSCGFGIVVLDMKRREIKDTYVIGNNGASIRVFSFTSDDNSFYAATEQGLKVASRNSPNLSNYAEWTTAQGLPSGNISHVVNFNNKIIVSSNNSIYEYDGTNWVLFYSDPQWNINNLSVNHSKMILCESNVSFGYHGRILIYTEGMTLADTLENSPIAIPKDAVSETNGIIWIADLLTGLVRAENNTVMESSIFPEGPTSTNVQNMSVERGELWVAPGGVDQSFGFNAYNRDGIFSFINNYWKTYNEYAYPILANSFNFWKVAVHPTDAKVYVGSWWSGLYEYENGNFTLYDKDNSILEGIPGFEERTVISGLAFDQDGNLWMTSYGALEPLLVKKADGTWLSFKTPGVKNNQVERIVIDDYNQKWVLVPRVSNQSLLVFNHGQELDNTSDDRYKILGPGIGSGNLPNNEVYSIAKDNDGVIWVGTAQGIAVFYCPYAVFSEQGCEAQQIIVTQNDVAGYLLETEKVTAIAVDGANRKWVGTSNGVFLLSPDGTQQIAYYTIDNSPLLSNSILDIAIDHQTGEVYLGTERGIVSVRGEATDSDVASVKVLVFPNPVREDYKGPIAIQGLANNASVKITDVIGNLFYETSALGGQAVWDGRNYNGERAKTGVYLVFTSNEDGSSTHITKLLIIN